MLVSIPQCLRRRSICECLFAEVGAEKLPDEEGPQLRRRQCSVSLLHGHGAPVVIAVEELHVRLPDQVVLGQAAERTQVSG